MTQTFINCTKLTETPTIADSVTDMNRAFSGCTNLVTVSKLSNNVTNLEMTFFNCTNLVSAPTIPNLVENMDHTFNACDKLEGPVYINTTNLQNCFLIFLGAGDKGTGITVVVPDANARALIIADTNTYGYNYTTVVESL